MKRWYFLLLLLLVPVVVSANATFTISDIRIVGNERIPDGTVLNYLPVHEGDGFDTSQSAHVIRELFKTGFFKDVSLARDGNVLVVNLVERPAIAEVKFEGNHDIDDDQLKDTLKKIGIIKGHVFNPTALDQIQQSLTQQVYYSRGKYGAKVKTEVKHLDKNRVSIVITISEGVIARIREINIIGNEVFSDETLLDQLKLGIPGFWDWFSSKDEYSKPKLSSDIESIRSYYQDRGYIRFDINSTSVSITPDKKDIYITINLTEGEQYHVKEIKLAGNLVVPEDQLKLLVRLKPGDLFSRAAMTEAKDLMTRKLGDEGYAFARIRVIPEINDQTKEVALTYFVEPGKKVYVRRITFSGNYKTHDEVLRREMRIMEGSELSNAKLERSKVRLQRLSFIEEVTIDKEPVAGTNDMVDININVTERLSGNFNIGAGFSQTQGFVFNMGLQMENLFGTGQKLGLNFTNDQANTVYSVSFTDPYYTVDGVSRTINLSYRKRDASQEAINNFLSNIYGANVLYGLPLSEFSRIQMGFGYEHTDILRSTVTATSQDVLDLLQTNGEPDSNGNYLKAGFDAITLTSNFVYDTRNRTVFANKGSQQILGLNLAAPGSDLEYYKVSYRSKFYFDLTDELTLLMRTDFAYGDGYGNNDQLPLYQRFYAGGLRTVRGFVTNSLGPIDPTTFDPRGGDIKTVAGAEMIFPVPFVEKAPRSIRFSAFYDIGNVYLQSEGGFQSDELRSAVGVSFVWLAPIGPLRFSWAKPVREQLTDDTRTFQFSIGSFF